MAQDRRNRENARRQARVDDIGKRILVGVTYLDAQDAIERQTEHVGVVEVINDRSISIRCADGQVTQFPPEVTDAPPGTYRLRSTGEEVVNPDLLAKWVMRPGDE